MTTTQTMFALAQHLWTYALDLARAADLGVTILVHGAQITGAPTDDCAVASSLPDRAHLRQLLLAAVVRSALADGVPFEQVDSFVVAEINRFAARALQ
jgi:hypothetical protein